LCVLIVRQNYIEKRIRVKQDNYQISDKWEREEHHQIVWTYSWALELKWIRVEVRAAAFVPGAAALVSSSSWYWCSAWVCRVFQPAQP
jgi:hypothetical protein